MAAAKLYGYWRSSAAYRVRLALRLKRVAYDDIAISLAPGDAEHRQDAYRALNPQMLVPYYDDGMVATGQSLAILEYLEEAHPEVPLLPDDPLGRAQVRSFSLAICCDIHPLNNLRVLRYLKGDLAVSNEQFDAWYRHWIVEGFAPAEHFAREHSASGSYVFGNSATFADVCLIPQVYNARRFNVPLDDFPTLRGIVDACNERPEFQASLPEAQADAS